MKTEKRRRGDYGERAALFYLLRRFYRVLARNYQADGGEIDLVAKRRGTLIFCEIKTRRLDPEKETVLTKPASAVDRDKRENLISQVFGERMNTLERKKMTQQSETSIAIAAFGAKGSGDAVSSA